MENQDVGRERAEGKKEEMETREGKRREGKRGRREGRERPGEGEVVPWEGVKTGEEGRKHAPGQAPGLLALPPTTPPPCWAEAQRATAPARPLRGAHGGSHAKQPGLALGGREMDGEPARQMPGWRAGPGPLRVTEAWDAALTFLFLPFFLCSFFWA